MTHWFRKHLLPYTAIRNLQLQVAALQETSKLLEADLVTAKSDLTKCTATVIAARNELSEQIRKLTAARELAEHSNRSKTDFLASMSHEIRTPMTSVIGFADLIAQDDVPPEKRRAYVEKIQRNGHHLLAVIDDILDLSKIEAGHMIITRNRFPLLLEMTQALDLLREQAERKNLPLIFVHDGAADVEMLSDQVRFRQILLNLVSNALKFTDHGSITVTLHVSMDKAEPDVEITVIDTGIGIEPALHSKLFQPFSQATMTAKKQRAGTGLGLTLVRNIARVLGGEAFLINSAIEKGSTFVVTLPLVAPEPPT